MAGTRRTDLLGRLADLSEETIQRLSDAPGADRIIGALNTMRDRVDELQKRVRGLEELEKRLTALERKVDKLGKAGASPPGGSRAGGKTASTKSSGATGADQS
jgi:phage shock protein A